MNLDLDFNLDLDPPKQAEVSRAEHLILLTRKRRV
jgi:hypothetical protein